MSQSHVTGTRLLRAILSTVAFVEDVPVELILGRSNVRTVTRARQRFMAEAYQTGRWSLPQIGAFIGRDHTTVLAGVRSHEAKLSTGKYNLWSDSASPVASREAP